MDITLKQLRAFVAVSHMGQFTLAAEKLGSSQSSVSTLIRQLEANLDLRLFDRHTRLLRLTQAGHDLLPVVARAVSDIEGMVESSRDLNALRRGKVSVAAGTVQAALLLPALVNEFNKLYPEIAVALYDVAEKVVVDYVASESVDLGVGTIPEGHYDLVGSRLTTDEFLAVLHPQDPLVKVAELRWVHLTGQKLIGPQRGNPIRDRLENELVRNGIDLPLGKTMQEIALPLTIIGMVEGGLGIAIMTSAVTRLVTSMGLVARTLTDPLLRRDVSLIQKRGRSLSPAARSFRNFLLRSAS